jgi:hypothetical protein
LFHGHCESTLQGRPTESLEIAAVPKEKASCYYGGWGTRIANGVAISKPDVACQRKISPWKIEHGYSGRSY